MEPPDTHFVRAPDGTAIAYHIAGNGPPDILLLGNPSCIDVLWEDPAYAHLHRRLCRLGRVICFDYRGLGSSDPLPLGELPTPEAWVEDIQLVLDAAGSTNVVIIGQGGAAGGWAMLFSAVHPRRVSRLVLVDSCARTVWAEDYPFGAAVDVIDVAANFMEQAWGTGAAGALSAPSRAADPTFCLWHARFERLALPPSLAARTFRWMFSLDVRAVLDTIHVPTLVLQFDANPWVAVEHGRYLAEHIPDAQLILLSGAGENLQFCAADSDLVLDHIEDAIRGASSTRETHRALATILFTDIVDSTRHAAALGDRRWNELLKEHRVVVDAEVSRYRGRTINTAGDGTFATFDGPAHAIRCAQAIGTALRPLGIEIRAGVHTGEVELDGDDVGGIAVHLGARICALAGQRQVLASSTVKDLVIGSGIEFDELGERELKDVPGVWRIFAVG